MMINTVLHFKKFHCAPLQRILKIKAVRLHSTMRWGQDESQDLYRTIPTLLVCFISEQRDHNRYDLARTNSGQGKK